MKYECTGDSQESDKYRFEINEDEQVEDSIMSFGVVEVKTNIFLGNIDLISMFPSRWRTDGGNLIKGTLLDGANKLREEVYTLFNEKMVESYG